MKNITYDDILDEITKKNRIPRLLILIIGSFIIALVYNAFVVPNSLVYGGLGGVAIIVNKYINIDTTIFIDIVTLILVVLSFIILGKKNTSYTIIGFVVYIIMVNITAPIAHFFQFKSDSFLLSIILYSLVSGFGYGLIYKAGFNTGGADSLVAILQKYVAVSNGTISNIINGIIIVVGAISFGLTKTFYAIIFLKILNTIVDNTILGVSTNKICFIKTNKIHQVKDMLNNDMEIGCTLLETSNGIGILKKTVIFCVLPSDRFYDLKNKLLKLDKRAELISNDCYASEGGTLNRIVKV